MGLAGVLNREVVEEIPAHSYPYVTAMVAWRLLRYVRGIHAKIFNGGVRISPLRLIVCKRKRQANPPGAFRPTNFRLTPQKTSAQTAQ
jgi:hypothetical protein